jgi:hypothetical protein
MPILLIGQAVLMGLMGVLSILGPMTMFTTAGPEVLGLLRVVGFTYLFIMMVTGLVIKQREDKVLVKFGFLFFLYFHLAFTLAHGMNALAVGSSFHLALVHGLFLLFFFLKLPRQGT